MCANYEPFHSKSLLKILHFGKEQRPLTSVILLLNAHFANWHNFCLPSSWEVLRWGWQLPQRTALGKHLPCFTLIWKDIVLNWEFILRKILVLISWCCSSENNYNIHHVLTLKFLSFCQESWILFKMIPSYRFHSSKVQIYYSSLSSKSLFFNKLWGFYS